MGLSWCPAQAFLGGMRSGWVIAGAMLVVILGGTLWWEGSREEPEPTDSPPAGKVSSRQAEAEPHRENLARSEPEPSNTSPPTRIADSPPPPTGEPTNRREPPPDPETEPPFEDWSRMVVEPSLQEIAYRWEADPQQWAPLILPMPDGSEVTMEVDEVELMGDDGGSFVGRVQDEPFSSVELSFRGRAESGTIRRPATNELVRMVPDGEGAVRMQVSSLSGEGQAGAGAGDFPIPQGKPSAAPPPLPPPMESGTRDSARKDAEPPPEAFPSAPPAEAPTMEEILEDFPSAPPPPPPDFDPPSR